RCRRLRPHSDSPDEYRDTSESDATLCKFHLDSPIIVIARNVTLSLKGRSTKEKLRSRDAEYGMRDGGTCIYCSGGLWQPIFRLMVRELQPILRKRSRAGGLAVTHAIMPETEILSPSQRIRGVLAPVVTPFKADLSPDRDRFIRPCRWLLSQNCGLAPFGTTSEANSLSAGERISLLDALVAADIDPSRMMPGTGCC